MHILCNPCGNLATWGERRKEKRHLTGLSEEAGFEEGIRGDRPSYWTWWAYDVRRTRYACPHWSVPAVYCAPGPLPRCHRLIEELPGTPSATNPFSPSLLPLSSCVSSLLLLSQFQGLFSVGRVTPSSSSPWLLPFVEAPKKSRSAQRGVLIPQRGFAQ